jgi:hypothetical protein
VVALSTSETVTFTVAGIFALIILLIFVRLMMRRTPPTWHLYRIGFFIERDPDPVPWPERDTKITRAGISEDDTWHK